MLCWPSFKSICWSSTESGRGKATAMGTAGGDYMANFLRSHNVAAHRETDAKHKKKKKKEEEEEGEQMKLGGVVSQKQKKKKRWKTQVWKRKTPASAIKAIPLRPLHQKSKSWAPTGIWEANNKKRQLNLIPCHLCVYVRVTRERRSVISGGEFNLQGGD